MPAVLAFLASQLSWRSLSVLKASHAGPATQHSESSAATAPRPQLALMQQPPFCSFLTRPSCQMRLFYGCLDSDLSCMSVCWTSRMSALPIAILSKYCTHCPVLSCYRSLRAKEFFMSKRPGGVNEDTEDIREGGQST